MPSRSIKTWWFFAAFFSGMALAMLADAMLSEDLILQHRNHRLEFSAPRTDFFAGPALTRLHNASEVSFVIKTTLFSGTKDHVFTSTVDKFVVSFDLWEEKFSVVDRRAQKSVKNLTAKAAQAWCLSQMSLDTTGLSGNQPLWARLEIGVEDPPRDGGLLGDSVTSSGISLPSLIEFWSRPGSQPQKTLEYPAFTLDQLRPTRGS
jgi:hypothetical protein